MAIKEGSFVKVEYTGSFDDGTVFDSSKKHGQPLQFQVGMKQMIPGFEKAVIGMGVGEEKEVILKPEEAYGQVNEQLIQKAPRDKVPSEIKVGMVLGMNLPDGKQIPARVTEVNDQEVTIDLNHELAGKTLHFKIKVIEVI